jgi:hypothetical protein
MARCSALRLAVLGTVLALLLPLVAVADSCGDCLWLASQDCCLKSCCPCCAHGSFALTAAARVDLGPAWSGLTAEPPADRFLSSHPRDVFHIPKPSLA